MYIHAYSYCLSSRGPTLHNSSGFARRCIAMISYRIQADCIAMISSSLSSGLQNSSHSNGLLARQRRVEDTIVDSALVARLTVSTWMTGHEWRGLSPSWSPNRIQVDCKTHRIQVDCSPAVLVVMSSWLISSSVNQLSYAFSHAMNSYHGHDSGLQK